MCGRRRIHRPSTPSSYVVLVGQNPPSAILVLRITRKKSHYLVSIYYLYLILFRLSESSVSVTARGGTRSDPASQTTYVLPHARLWGVDPAHRGVRCHRSIRFTVQPALSRLTRAPSRSRRGRARPRHGADARLHGHGGAPNLLLEIRP